MARPNAYVDALVGYREGRIMEWCVSFARACERAALLSVELAEAIAKLQAEWFQRAGRPRRDSAAARIIRALPSQPITSAPTIHETIGASHQRALDGLKVLADVGIVRQITQGGYDRQYASDELFGLIEAYEGRIAAAA